jgi:hypothetical protein
MTETTRSLIELLEKNKHQNLTEAAHPTRVAYNKGCDDCIEIVRQHKPVSVSLEKVAAKMTIGVLATMSPAWRTEAAKEVLDAAEVEYVD